MRFLFNKNRKQLKAVFDWLVAVIDRNDLILVEREKRAEGYFFGFPLKIGDKPKKLRRIEGKEFTFLIRIYPGRSAPETKWKPIFRSKEIAVYENEKRFEGKRFHPLRWGFDGEEKRAALRVVREALEGFLEEKQPSRVGSQFPLRWNLVRADLAVTLWTGGVLRGSAVVENVILSEGLAQAAVLACRDARFKPLKNEELPVTRIEIVILSDLKIPLAEEAVKNNELMPEKGYLLRRDKKRGWFLPEVFNARSFKGLKEFIFRLALEKAGVQPKEAFDKKTEILIFEVDNFIEEEEGAAVTTLSGPMVRFEEREGKTKEVANAAADWLLKVQEADGNFIPIVNPLTGRTAHLDWPRSLLAGWSLVEFGKVIGQCEYIEAGRRNFLYGKKYLLDERIVKDANRESLDLAYLGQEALSLDLPQEALRCGSRILEQKDELGFEPILFSQIGSFLAELSRIDKLFMPPALTFVQTTQAIFAAQRRQGKLMYLAVWAELANSNLKLFGIQDNQVNLSAARSVIDWLLGYQLADGSFPAATDPYRSFPNTRGAGKIAEVLAGFLLQRKNIEIDRAIGRDYHKDCLEKTFAWLSAMQYSSSSSYFIPRKNLEMAIGGFRHDYFNHEAWIDSAGHFLLGASRFLSI